MSWDYVDVTAVGDMYRTHLATQFNNYPDDPDYEVYNVPWKDYLPPVEDGDE